MAISFPTIALPILLNAREGLSLNDVQASWFGKLHSIITITTTCLTLHKWIVEKKLLKKVSNKICTRNFFINFLFRQSFFINSTVWCLSHWTYCWLLWKEDRKFHCKLAAYNSLDSYVLRMGCTYSLLGKCLVGARDWHYGSTCQRLRRGDKVFKTKSFMI